MQPNQEESVNNELTVMSSDIESDGEKLLASDESACKQALSWAYSRRFIKSELTKYYHWLLILFKNGYWRTTVLLWYLR